MLPAVLALALVVAAVAGWLLLREAVPTGSDQKRSSASLDPAAPTGWGPTAGELAEARATVADWSDEQLAGQVIVGRWHGTDPEAAAELVRDLHLAGLSMQSENVVDAEQVRATNAAVAEAVADSGRAFPPVIGVDQEGGVVAHLAGIASEYPSWAHAGRALEGDPESAPALLREAATAQGLELRGLGFTWVWAPVADVSDGSDPTIGSRSPSEDPRLAAQATTESVTGFNAAGIVSTTKHFPGHGGVDGDSHDELPRLGSTLRELRAHDLVPFAAAVEAQAPSVMMSHLDVTAVQPGVPATLAEQVYGLLEDEIGFEGVVVTDSLGMGAVMGQKRLAVRALLAGADLLLMPAEPRVAHAALVEALGSGDLPRERVEDAAATVVAMQLWQARVAASVVVPEDATARAEDAAEALDSAG